MSEDEVQAEAHQCRYTFSPRQTRCSSSATTGTTLRMQNDCKSMKPVSLAECAIDDAMHEPSPPDRGKSKQECSLKRCMHADFGHARKRIFSVCRSAGSLCHAGRPAHVLNAKAAEGQLRRVRLLGRNLQRSEQRRLDCIVRKYFADHSMSGLLLTLSGLFLHSQMMWLPPVPCCS